jgi:hypothetical protein
LFALIIKSLLVFRLVLYSDTSNELIINLQMVGLAAGEWVVARLVVVAAGLVAGLLVAAGLVVGLLVAGELIIKSLLVFRLML